VAGQAIVAVENGFAAEKLAGRSICLRGRDGQGGAGLSGFFAEQFFQTVEHARLSTNKNAHLAVGILACSAKV